MRPITTHPDRVSTDEKHTGRRAHDTSRAGIRMPSAALDAGSEA